MTKMIGFYAVALTFTGEVAKELSRLREKYNRYVSYTIEPHLTLEYPFVPEVDLSIINEKLKAVARRTRPFTLVLSGIEYFEGTSNVAYVAVENKRTVVDLHTDIVYSLKGLIGEGDKEGYKLERFIPHVTIGECIPSEVFPTVKKRLSDYELHYESEIVSFVLFSVGKDEKWEPARVFELSG